MFYLPEVLFTILREKLINADMEALFKHLVQVKEISPKQDSKLPSQCAFARTHESYKVNQQLIWFCDPVKVQIQVKYLLPLQSANLMHMKFRGLIVIIILLGLPFIQACKSSGDKDAKISTDLVNNPNSASGDNNQGNLPVFKFEEIEHDFGKILQGESVAYDFGFTNTGKTDLIIVDVSTSCGCTVPSFPKTPIQPGEKGAIKVSFNSAGKFGLQTKNVLVVANTQPNTTLLRIKVQIVSPNSDK
jgi:hypothetical protein